MENTVIRLEPSSGRPCLEVRAVFDDIVQKATNEKTPIGIAVFRVSIDDVCVRCSLSVVVAAAVAVHLRSIARRPVVTPAAIYLNVRRQSATAFAATAAAAAATACRT